MDGWMLQLLGRGAQHNSSKSHSGSWTCSGSEKTAEEEEEGGSSHDRTRSQMISVIGSVYGLDPSLPHGPPLSSSPPTPNFSLPQKTHKCCRCRPQIEATHSPRGGGAELQMLRSSFSGRLISLGRVGDDGVWQRLGMTRNLAS